MTIFLGNPLTPGGVECKGYEKIAISDQYFKLAQDRAILQ